MIQANYGYEKVVSGGVITLRIKRNRSAFVATVWVFAIFMSVVLMLIATQINNGRGGPPPGVFLVACLVLIGIAILCSFGRSYTRVSMGKDRLSLDSGAEYAKGDIGNIRIHEPGIGGFTYTSDFDYQSKLALRKAVASQNHSVTFDYGATTVLLAGKLTAPQADRVGTEFANWLSA